MYHINSYLSSVGVDGIFCPIRKNLWLGNFLNLKLNTRLPTKKIRKLDVKCTHLRPKLPRKLVEPGVLEKMVA